MDYLNNLLKIILKFLDAIMGIMPTIKVLKKKFKKMTEGVKNGELGKKCLIKLS